MYLLRLIITGYFRILFQITEADCYPKYVCKMCLEELKIAFQFKKKCEASDFVFRKAITHETVLGEYK